MVRAMRMARDWHVNKPGKPELISGAIEGMLAKIDPEAELLSPTDLRRMARLGQPNSIQALPLGLEVRREPAGRRRTSRGYVVVTSQDGSPAARAGLKAGDLIIAVDDTPTGSLSHVELTVGRLAARGALGSTAPIKLRVDREGVAETVDLILERTTTPAPTPTLDAVSPGITYVRVAAFDDGVVAQIKRDLEFILARSGEAMRGAVLDLRSVAGGNLDEAVALADLFIDQGDIAKIRARRSDGDRTYRATKGDVLAGRPLMVLVDEGTAGPAEIVAAALRSVGRGRLIGEKTAGRGAIRTLVPVGAEGDKGMMRLTTAHMVTAAGRRLEGQALVPDVPLEQSPADKTCRTLDQGDPATPNRCVRRPLASDGQLMRAAMLLGEAQSAAANPGAGPATPQR